jgi:hypothetical protein
MQPADVKHAVQQITSTPLAELASVLRGFKWTFDKVSLTGCV